MKKPTEGECGFAARLLGAAALAGLATFVIVAQTVDAGAAGFALKEQSAKAQGNAFAGATAGAEDVTYMFFNPAALSRLDGNAVAVVTSYITATAETTDAVGSGGGEASQDGGTSAVVPASYFALKINPDLTFGLGINAPFGLATEYNETWAGRYFAVDSELAAVNINPAIAYQFNDRVSMGFGLQLQYVDVKLSNMLPASCCFGFETLSEVEGDDFGFGYNLGILFELSDATRIGAAYRSQISHELVGDLYVRGTGLSSFAVAKADFTSPASANIGVYHDINDQFAVMADVGWTGWNSFDELRVEFSQNFAALPDSVTDESWDNSWFASIGATWRPNEQLTVRTGVAYDQSPIPDATRSPRIPGNDRTWVSLGAGYQVTPGISLSAGYTHIFVTKGSVDLTDADAGTLTATFESSVDIVVAQAVMKF